MQGLSIKDEQRNAAQNQAQGVKGGNPKQENMMQNQPMESEQNKRPGLPKREETVSKLTPQ